ncbi:MAG: hypothetical protein A2600_07270 [Candidatus Lambdaproteobacteria bacterium RIFOXYD1_FULL_56_27]|uniref:ABC transporter domain-containing protein n=1 Tax=Candidatus Lambdaproteobacteria bacterium RIFOXYD2_FULL_56_26 TaxID=1817773 RepID=A0A1F6GQG0_9PROT|nr:MAG: hypothetical protein A2557_05930 [Candidatus Lambdaproteobacteria bacterium RIFOXYD2_FULL_56_26]OGH03732.1 MAG: hypothetical protein A2426_00720 [Candidatus Lambdaproteobacteria bacterium RIFOXYC1_FULL_56_13]OGH07316.1 MAG: hypothetical protein A2600_07270 [Candidatus Lambdaproteobacteria bacterium RIFOXYD1_FULL_56_27]
MIEAIDLKKSFGVTQAVKGVSFSVKKGEIVGFLGPNGAGKSTTLRLLTGYLSPDSGEARIEGFSITKEPLAAKSRIGYLPESAASYKAMTVFEYLHFAAQLRGLEKEGLKRAVGLVIEKTKLAEVVNKTIGTLSKGFRQRVGFAQALVHDPPVLVLDEPTDGLDPNQKREVRKLIRSLAQEKAILLSTHILEEMEAVCDRAIVLNQGQIVAQGTPAELLARSKRQGAVELGFAAPVSVEAQTALFSTAGLVGLEVLGDRRLLALAQPGTSLLVPLQSKLAQLGLEPQEIFVHKGSMEEVFAQLTQGGTP